jgi:hypothetical protein
VLFPLGHRNPIHPHILSRHKQQFGQVEAVLAGLPAAAAAGVLLRYHDHARLPVQPARRALGLGIAKAIFDTVVHPLHIAGDTVLIFMSGLIIAALLADLIVRSRGDT